MPTKSVIAKEKAVIEQMIRLYCRHKEGNARLCPDCKALLAYALARLDHCRWGEEKPSCRRCPIHCYRRDMRTRIREVMRYAGPRMLLYHPLFTLRHWFS